MASNEALTNRSIGILVNLSAGLDETGRECDDDRVQLTANLRLAAAAGAAALSQRSKRSTPFANDTGSPNVKLVKSAAGWLDQLKQAKGFHGDVTAAEFLGVSPTQFSRWRTGKDLLDNYHACWTHAQDDCLLRSVPSALNIHSWWDSRFDPAQITVSSVRPDFIRSRPRCCDSQPELARVRKNDWRGSTSARLHRRRDE